MVWEWIGKDTHTPPQRTVDPAFRLSIHTRSLRSIDMPNPIRKSRRGRKPILTAAQKRTLLRMVHQEFKAELRRWAKEG
jgi:hypothetical protein